MSTVECVILECDHCKNLYENYAGHTLFLDFSAAIYNAKEDGWQHIQEANKEDLHYCDFCHIYNESDELLLDPTRKDLHLTKP